MNLHDIQGPTPHWTLAHARAAVPTYWGRLTRLFRSDDGRVFGDWHSVHSEEPRTDFIIHVIEHDEFSNARIREWNQTWQPHGGTTWYIGENHATDAETADPNYDPDYEDEDEEDD